MDFFADLNKTSAECLQYIPFEKFVPGRYNVQEFFNTHNSGERISINFNDEYYIMLPKRFTTRKYSMEKMNNNPTDFIFRGKQSQFVVDFTFAPADLEKCEQIQLIGDDVHATK